MKTEFDLEGRSLSQILLLVSGRSCPGRCLGHGLGRGTGGRDAAGEDGLRPVGIATWDVAEVIAR